MRQPLKPSALKRGDAVRLISPASPIQERLFDQGCAELVRLGYTPRFDREAVLARNGFMAGAPQLRADAFREALTEPTARAIFCNRGGYGANYLIDTLGSAPGAPPKILLGCSDVSSLQIFLWETRGWVTFYGPMVATNFSRGAGALHGYDCRSLSHALSETQSGWRIDLPAEPLAASSSSASAEGTVLGGCLTLVETALGTPWELQTEGSILVLEDRGMKPYQVDRSLMHLKQAGKFRDVAAILLGDFPDCEPAAPADETVRDVARRVLGPLDVPIVWGAPIGHTARPMLTIPLGVRARLAAGGQGAPSLEILEPACLP
jgi:muramoyltetrapeptide carboxypeptidase